MRWKWLTVGGLGGAVLLAGLFKHVTLAQAQGRWTFRVPETSPSSEASRIGPSSDAGRYARRNASGSPGTHAGTPDVRVETSPDAQRLRDLLVKTQQRLSQLAAEEHVSRQTIAHLRAALSRRDDQLEQLSTAFERA